MPVLCYCVGHDSGAFDNRWVSGSLEGEMYAPLHSFILLRIQGIFMWLEFSWLPTPFHVPFFFIVSLLIYIVGSPLLFQFSERVLGRGLG